MTDTQPAPTGTARAVPQGTSHPQLDELIAVLELLRAPGGCAWDAEQTHESLVRYLVEETYELIDAIESGNREEMIEELGDVLYQVVFHSDIAAHTSGEEFTLEDVAAHMTAKMVGRHPHVFGDAVADTASDVNQRWDEIKKVEKPGRKSTLDGVPQAMPALLLADKLLGKAEKLGVGADRAAAADAHKPAEAEDGDGPGAGVGVGVDPTDIDGPDIFASEDALGAALLVTVSEARQRGLDPERALRGALRDLQDRMRAAESAHPANPAV